MAHYYIDASAVGANNGTSPADAWSAFPIVIAAVHDPVAYIWVRRSNGASATSMSNGTSADLIDIQSSDEVTISPTVGRRYVVVAKWPNPGDLLYDVRPAAGTSAGWDADNSAHVPAFTNTRTTSSANGIDTSYNCYVEGIIWDLGRPGATSTSYGILIDDNKATNFDTTWACIAVRNCNVTFDRGRPTLSGWSATTVLENVHADNDYANPSMSWGGADNTEAKQIAVGSSLNNFKYGPLNPHTAVNVGNKFTNQQIVATRGSHSDAGWLLIDYDLGGPCYSPRVNAVGCHFATTAATQDPGVASQFTIAQIMNSGKYREITINATAEPPSIVTHNTAAALDAYTRHTTAGVISSTTSYDRGGSPVQIQFVCNKHSWELAWSQSSAVHDYMQVRKGITRFPNFSAPTFPATHEEMFQVPIDNTSPKTLTVYAQVSGINIGTYGGAFPDSDTFYVVALYPSSSTEYAVKKSTQSFSANDSYTAFTVSFTPGRVAPVYWYVVFYETLSYPNRVLANQNLSLPDWYLIIDPKAEIA